MARKRNVNDELQKMQKMLDLTRKRSDLLGSIYDDFYGAGKNITDTLNESIRRMTEDVDKAAKAPVADQEALQKADDALKEAKEMFGQEQAVQTAAAPAPEVPAEPERDPMVELNELIGLETIKHDVLELASFAKIQKMRKDQGLKAVPISMHLVFTGNPGTGKTRQDNGRQDSGKTL